MSSLRREFTAKAKVQNDAMNIPVQITGFESSKYKEKDTDFVVGINLLTNQPVKIFLKDKASVGEHDVTASRLNPENKHRHAVPIGGIVNFEGCYSNGDGVYYSRYAKKNYSKTYAQSNSNLMASLHVRDGYNGKDGNMFLRVYDPQIAVMVDTSSLDNVYNMIKESFLVDFPVPDSDKFSRSVMIRMRRDDDWATTSIQMPIIKDAESGKFRMSTPEEAVDIFRNEDVSANPRAKSINQFIKSLSDFDSIEMIPSCGLTFGKDEKDKYFDPKTKKLLSTDAESFEKMNGLTKRSALYINRMKDLSKKVLSYEGEGDEIVPTFFDANILMYKSKDANEDEKRPFIVSLMTVNGSQNVPTVEIHDIPTVNFDPIDMIPNKFKHFGDLPAYNAGNVENKTSNDQQSFSNSNSQQQVNAATENKTQPEQAQPEHSEEKNDLSTVDDIGISDEDEDIIAELSGLFSQQP
jgi:hypothetical protein